MKQKLASFLLVGAFIILSAFGNAPANDSKEYYYTARIPVPVAQQVVGRGQFIQQVLDKQDNLPHGVVRELKAQIDTMLMLYTQSLKLDSTIIKK